MSQGNHNWLERVWYGKSPVFFMLLPLSWIYALLTMLRRYFYRCGILRIQVIPVPVIIVGNITVGGTGKTPLAIWLAQQLQEAGYAPGIITRGYRGNVGSSPVVATRESDASIVGDEAVVLARRCTCPVIVHPDRVAAANKAVELGVNVVISDDGLQHYRLGRDFEIVVIDGARGFGNGHLLPAGPLREAETRLSSVEEILVQGEASGKDRFLVRSTDPGPRYFALKASAISRLGGDDDRHIEEFAGKSVHAVAGIGNPERFFGMLESFGISVIRHPMRDHAVITAADLLFEGDAEIVMTEKDAVKCSAFDTSRCWYVPADIEFEAEDRDALMRAVLEKITARTAASE